MLKTTITLDLKNTESYAKITEKIMKKKKVLEKIKENIISGNFNANETVEMIDFALSDNVSSNSTYAGYPCHEDDYVITA